MRNKCSGKRMEKIFEDAHQFLPNLTRQDIIISFSIYSVRVRYFY